MKQRKSLFKIQVGLEPVPQDPIPNKSSPKWKGVFGNVGADTIMQWATNPLLINIHYIIYLILNINDDKDTNISPGAQQLSDY